MPAQLSCDVQTGALHLLTLTCAGRHPYLAGSAASHRMLKLLEEARGRYGFRVDGYVVMPEHVHLLVSAPRRGTLGRAIQTFKATVTRNAPEHPFWQLRFDDLTMHTEEERIEVLRGMHRNPVRRGLAERPEQWPWSSFRAYLFHTPGTVRIDALGLAAQQELAAQPGKGPSSEPGLKTWMQGMEELLWPQGEERRSA